MAAHPPIKEDLETRTVSIRDGYNVANESADFNFAMATTRRLIAVAANVTQVTPEDEGRGTGRVVLQAPH
jgi:hypothetical protein